ncbi:MAG: protein-glutamate O-methyltransferase CheR [Spongiibacteraceae bacterium]
MSSWLYQAPAELSDEQYAQWQTLLEERTGICLLQHKSILHKGLSLRMRELGVKDYEQYLQQVSAVPGGLIEWGQFVDRVSVKETSFFREINSFNTVRDFLLQRIEALTKADKKTVDLWSVGCSTGEEAYSLAMVANEAIDYLLADIFVGVTASDISTTALRAARKACYAKRKLDNLPLALKNKYFVKTDQHEYQVTERLRQNLCFIQSNVLELSKLPNMAMDVIYCQNLLVYFRRGRQWQVLNALVNYLKPGGLLVIGPGEVVGWQNSQMQRNGGEKVLAFIKQ